MQDKINLESGTFASRRIPQAFVLVTQVVSLKKSGLGVKPGFEMEYGLGTETGPPDPAAMSGMMVPHEDFVDEVGNRKPFVSFCV